MNIETPKRKGSGVSGYLEVRNGALRQSTTKPNSIFSEAEIQGQLVDFKVERKEREGRWYIEWDGKQKFHQLLQRRQKFRRAGDELDQPKEEVGEQPENYTH